jgi:3-hydroxyacyl-[acyl-carrier-protein] dehydratase
VSSATIFGLDEILKFLPHRPPFLFVDRVVKFKPDTMIVTERDLLPDEPHFAGHFPGKPIMPGVLVVDGLAQTCGLLWGFSRRADGSLTEESPKIFYLAACNVKFVNPSEPGETLSMTAYPSKSFGTLYTFDVEASAGRNTIAKGSLTLAMIKS